MTSEEYRLRVVDTERSPESGVMAVAVPDR